MKKKEHGKYLICILLEWYANSDRSACFYVSSIINHCQERAITRNINKCKNVHMVKPYLQYFNITVV